MNQGTGQEGDKSEVSREAFSRSAEELAIKAEWQHASNQCKHPASFHP
jgi:hypothetical protein